MPGPLANYNIGPSPVYYPPTDVQTNPSPPTITTNPIPPATGLPPVPPQITADQLGPNWYGESAIDNAIDIDTGILQVPVAGPAGTPCEMVRMHAPMAHRVAEWTAERVGAMPSVPAPQTNNLNEVPLRLTLYPCTYTTAPDGKQVFRLSGRYVYGMFVPPNIGTDPLPVGAVAYDTNPAAANNVPGSAFNPNLLDSSSAVPAGFVPPSN